MDTSSDAAWVQAIATAILVGITGVYAWLTYQLNKESQDSRELSQLPVIACCFEDHRPESGEITHIGTVTWIHLRNVGNAPALSTRIQVKLENRKSNGFAVDDIEKTVGTLGLDEPYRLTLEGTFSPDPDHEGKYELPRISLTLSCKNVFGRTFSQSSEHQLHSDGEWSVSSESRSME